MWWGSFGAHHCAFSYTVVKDTESAHDCGCRPPKPEAHGPGAVEFRTSSWDLGFCVVQWAGPGAAPPWPPNRSTSTEYALPESGGRALVDQNLGGGGG